MTKKNRNRAAARDAHPHPRNRYSENAPDFALLASRCESFAKFVRWSASGKASIDWCDYSATRELTRVLLQQDYGVKWWIPDGQLCPTVTNRANYIHWIEDLLQDFPNAKSNGGVATGVDIGTGASCIYPLLGASLRGWRFVATDVTSVALDWACKNVEQNPHLASLIEVRNSGMRNTDSEQEARVEVADRHAEGDGDELAEGAEGAHEVLHSKEEKVENTAAEDHADELAEGAEGANEVLHSTEEKFENTAVEDHADELAEGAEGAHEVLHSAEEKVENTAADDRRELGDSCENPGDAEDRVLVGVITDGETFDFCMCNPPFFESMEEAGLNPRTACGGTKEEMVCSGGEAAFVARIIADSIQLGTRIHWYTSMVGKKASLKVLTTELRKSGVTMLRTTEFVQGRTSRWGLAWSFSPPPVPSSLVVSAKAASFMLEGLNRQCSAWDVLQSLVAFLEAKGATCAVDRTNFTVTGSILCESGAAGKKRDREGLLLNGQEQVPQVLLSFKVSVLQQAPGCLLIKASSVAGATFADSFLSILKSAEAALRERFMSRARPKG